MGETKHKTQPVIYCNQNLETKKDHQHFHGKQKLLFLFSKIANKLLIDLPIACYPQPPGDFVAVGTKNISILIFMQKTEWTINLCLFMYYTYCTKNVKFN